MKENRLPYHAGKQAGGQLEDTLVRHNREEIVRAKLRLALVTLAHRPTLEIPELVILLTDLGPDPKPIDAPNSTEAYQWRALCVIREVLGVPASRETELLTVRRLLTLASWALDTKAPRQWIDVTIAELAEAGYGRSRFPWVTPDH